MILRAFNEVFSIPWYIASLASNNMSILCAPWAYIRKVFEKRALLFLEDAWEPYEGETKISFVFAVPEHYRLFNELIDRYSLNGLMSSILVDLRSGRVMEEHYLSPKPSTPKHSIFEEPLIFMDEEVDLQEVYDVIGEMYFQEEE